MFAERLKSLRKNKNLTQIEFAKVFSISAGAIAMWETGKREPDNSTMSKIADYFGVTVDYLLGREPIENEVDLDDNYPVPILGRVVAGVPIESAENVDGYIYINYKPKEYFFALRVHGDSMINAGIRDSSILVVRKQSYSDNGDIIVALLNGEQTVKRYRIFGNSAFLMPENPSYEPIPINPNDDFLVLGKVVEVRFAF